MREIFKRKTKISSKQTVNPTMFFEFMNKVTLEKSIMNIFVEIFSHKKCILNNFYKINF